MQLHLGFNRLFLKIAFFKHLLKAHLVSLIQSEF